jgi:hypothetical protein
VYTELGATSASVDATFSREEAPPDLNSEPFTKNSTSNAAADATEPALPTSARTVTAVSEITLKLRPPLNVPMRPSVTVPPAGPNPRPATVNTTALLLLVNTTDGVKEVSTRGACTVT